MLWWLKSGQVSEHQQLSQRLGHNPSTITRWLQRYRQGGLSALHPTFWSDNAFFKPKAPFCGIPFSRYLNA